MHDFCPLTKRKPPRFPLLPQFALFSASENGCRQNVGGKVTRKVQSVLIGSDKYCEVDLKS